MKCKMLLFSLFALFLFDGVLFAQSKRDLLLDKCNDALSPLEKRFSAYAFDLSQQINGKMIGNPSALQLLIETDSAFRNRFSCKKNPAEDSLGLLRIGVETGYSYGHIGGEYLPYCGNNFQDFHINTSLVHTLNNKGSFLGAARYSKGRHCGYQWNAIRHAEIYLPYVVADSTGGDYDYEDYFFYGGYAWGENNFYYGFEGSYRGEIACRKTDPRCANTTAWLSLGGNMSVKAGDDMYGLRAFYLYNRQHLALRNWRPNQQDRFYLVYGFGFFDIQSSPISFGINRMYYLNGAEAEAFYKRNESEKTFSCALDYAFCKIKTEESNRKNLFDSKTHYLTGGISYSQTFTTFQIEASVTSSNTFRMGLENIYESYLPDPSYPNIYDYRIVSIRSRYRYLLSGNIVQCKFWHSVGKRVRIGYSGGCAEQHRSENYTDPYQHLHTDAVVPMLGVDFQYINRNFDVEIKTLAMYRKLLDKAYAVTPIGLMTDFQHAFTPYAYYCFEGVGGKMELQLSRSIKNTGTVGLLLDVMAHYGGRPHDVQYAGIPSVQSDILSTPMPPEKKMEFWAKASLFWML